MVGRRWLSLRMLEDEAVQFTPFGIEGDLPSDRVDSMVWLWTYLFPSLIPRAGKSIPASPPAGHGRLGSTGY